MEEKIICPCCNKEMKITRSPFYGFYHTECDYCHIFITTKDLSDTSYILNTLYCGQWDFEIKYIDGKIEYARIGGGYRPPISEEEKI